MSVFVAWEYEVGWLLRPCENTFTTYDREQGPGDYEDSNIVSE